MMKAPSVHKLFVIQDHVHLSTVETMLNDSWKWSLESNRQSWLIVQETAIRREMNRVDVILEKAFKKRDGQSWMIHSWLWVLSCWCGSHLMKNTGREEEIKTSNCSGLVWITLVFWMPKSFMIVDFQEYLRRTLLEKISWEGEFTLRSDPWAGLIASCGSF